jgi:hypothetical protein
MKRAACLLVVLAACAGEDAANRGGTNPPTLWLAMNTGQTTMQLVADEPRPY